MIKKVAYSFFILLLIFFSCRSNFIDVERPTKDTPLNKEGIFYVLPLSKIIVEVEISKIIKTKGPYVNYTEKYLGKLSNVIRENNTTWELNNISFHSVSVPDSQNVFYLTQNTGTPLPVKLTKEGFLISYNCDEEYTSNDYKFFKNNTYNNSELNFSFDIISSDKAYKIKYDTIYKIQTYDTIIKKIPILKPSIVKKTIEEQAEELADKITILTDDRAALLVGEGDNDYLPQGAALKLMLNQIDNLMASYIKMFIGQTDTIHYKYYYTYTPTKDDINTDISLFKFSINSGVLPVDNLFGEDVILKFSSISNLKSIEDYTTLHNFYFTSDKPKNKGLYYRIPQKVKLQVLYKNQILAENSMLIAQLGTVTFLPAKMFNNENLKIKFYPDLGSIKQIYY